MHIHYAEIYSNFRFILNYKNKMFHFKYVYLFLLDLVGFLPLKILLNYLAFQSFVLGVSDTLISKMRRVHRIRYLRGLLITNI